MTSTPTAAPATSRPPAQGGITVDGLVEVLVTDLVIRTGASVDPDTSAVVDGRLTIGDRAFVVNGPVQDSGYTWYQVAPLLRPDGSAAAFGWIAAASREGEPWVRPAEPACPGAVNLMTVLALQPLERLACFGDQRLQLSSARISCGIADGPWTGDPAWLASFSGCGLAEGDDVLAVRTPPGGRDVATYLPGPVTVRGHFDDPASATCTITSAVPEVPAPPREQAVLLCRTQFVSED